jgi:DNA transposition AAA+ family ATPase
MKKVFVKTQNVKNFTSLMEKLQNKPETTSRMALVYGEPGLGKSRTALWFAAQNDCVYLRSSNMMSGRWLLEELVEELGEIPYSKTSDLFKQITDQLRDKPKTIIVDEIDYLLSDAKSIETLRDIYDKTNVPLVLIGMNQADKKLIRYKHIYDRTSEILKFNPFSKTEIKHILNELSEVEFDESAITLIYQKINKFRQITNILTKSEALAKANNLTVITGKLLELDEA